MNAGESQFKQKFQKFTGEYVLENERLQIAGEFRGNSMIGRNFPSDPIRIDDILSFNNNRLAGFPVCRPNAC
jgi:hypothetical protein